MSNIMPLPFKGFYMLREVFPHSLKLCTRNMYGPITNGAKSNRLSSIQSGKKEHVNFRYISRDELFINPKHLTLKIFL